MNETTNSTATTTSSSSKQTTSSSDDNDGDQKMPAVSNRSNRSNSSSEKAAAKVLPGDEDEKEGGDADTGKNDDGTMSCCCTEKKKAALPTTTSSTTSKTSDNQEQQLAAKTIERDQRLLLLLDEEQQTPLSNNNNNNNNTAADINAWANQIAPLPDDGRTQGQRRTAASYPGAFFVSGIGGPSASSATAAATTSGRNTLLAANSAHTTNTATTAASRSRANDTVVSVTLTARLAPSELIHARVTTVTTPTSATTTTTTTPCHWTCRHHHPHTSGETSQNPRHCNHNSTGENNGDMDLQDRSQQNGSALSPQPQPLLVEAKIEQPERPWNRWKYGVILFVLILTVILMSLGLAGVFRYSDNQNDVGRGPLANTDNTTSTSLTSTMAPQPASTSLLDQVRNTGVLKCGYVWIPGFIWTDEETGQVTGFNAAWCKAIAAAVLGPDNLETKVKFVEYDPLYQQGMHLNILSITHNMHRDVGQPRSQLPGRSYSIPYFYDGVHLAGDPFYIECAEDKNFKHLDECENLHICAQEDTTHHELISGFLPQRRIVPMDSPSAVIEGFLAGACNVFMFETLGEDSIREWGYTGNYSAGKATYSKEPIAIETVKDDPRWSDFISAVVHALVTAEKHNITQSTAHLFPQTTVFGDEFKNMFRHALQSVGNYGEIYERFLGKSEPRGSINHINNGSTGLMYSHPFGDLDPFDAELVDSIGQSLDRILQRGYLLCGVRLDRPGFAFENGTNIAGMEIDFCQAIAASLFGGDVEAVKFVVLANPADGYSKLASREVDVFAGATWNLENDVQEPTTGLGFAFSQPYFYGYSEQEDNICLATMQDDHFWKAYVYWLVASTIYAEEEGITQVDSNRMPLIYTFGSGLERMVRDAVGSVGNYGEIYDRSLNALVPRSGRNLLNVAPYYGPQHYSIPGMI